MIKAIAGGGGRGMRPVRDKAELERTYQLCRAEANQAFGNADVYVEQLFPKARHVEVQIVGDGQGSVSHLYERECSVQRQRQKIIEIAPAPSLAAETRGALQDAALKLARAANYRNLGTFEFLVDASSGKRFVFIEANGRLQVEHTVTEEVTGIDLVRSQLEIARGQRLADIGLDQSSISSPRGIAIQLRVNMETMKEDGSVRPGGGTLSVFEPPTGPGIRVDTFGYAGYQTNPRFDSLLAKVIVLAKSGDLAEAASRACRVLSEFRLVGVPTNMSLLQAILRHAEFQQGTADTQFVEEHLDELLAVGKTSGSQFCAAGGGCAPGTARRCAGR